MEPKQLYRDLGALTFGLREHHDRNQVTPKLSVTKYIYSTLYFMQL